MVERLHCESMGKAYSQDLRLLVLRAVDSGQSKLSVHRTFGISRSTIDDWLALRKQTGSLTPKPRVVKSRSAITDGAAFEEFAARHSGSTLRQMSAAWQQENGRLLSINTFSLALRRIGWTRKKRVFSTPSATPRNGPSSSGN